MSAEVEFDDKNIREFLLGIDTKLKNIKEGKREYLGLLSAIVFRDIISHFQQEEGSEGKWKHWSDSYKEYLEMKGRSGNQILQYTGRLRNSFKPTNVRSSSQGISWFNDAKTKSGFPYAYAHNEGGEKLPKRDFMWASDKAQDSMAEQTLQFMIEKGI